MWDVYTIGAIYVGIERSGMFLEEFRALPVLGSSMAASSGLFTCYLIIPSGQLETSPINIKLIINEKKEEVSEPEPKEEEPEVIEEIVPNEPEPIPEPIPQPQPKPVVLPPEPKPKPNKKTGRKIPRPKGPKKNYRAKKRDYRDVFHVEPTSGQSYWLYRAHGPLDFSFRFPEANPDFSDIKRESIRIKLFKKSVWEDNVLWEDEYDDHLTQDQIKDLFGDLDPNKTKQLLFSLSVKRTWTRHVDDHYTSDRPNTLHRKLWYMDIGVKYFNNFLDFKEYVQAKVENCEDDVPCIAKESELSILPQDKISFFSD